MREDQNFDESLLIGYKCEEHIIYFGQLNKLGIRQGWGRTWHRYFNNLYEGQMENLMFNGYARYIYGDNSGKRHPDFYKVKYYIGHWKNDCRHGKGTRYWNDGKKIE